MAHPELQTSCNDLINTNTDLLATIKRLCPFSVKASVIEHLGTEAQIFFENGYLTSAKIADDGSELVIRIRI